MEWASQFVAEYGYWAVFVWTFIEGESVFIAAAALAAAGLMEPWKVIVVAALGAYVGHLVFFALGRWRGLALIEAVPALYRHYPKVNLILDRYAHWSIFIFQYLYGTRMAAAILFGCSSIGFLRFASWQVVNCISWALLIYTVGHLLGVAAVTMLDYFGVVGLLVAVVVVVALCFLAGGRLHQRVLAWWQRLS
ncbi:MAG: VTT domain-containing protein [Mariprofundales bacterium]